MKSESGSLVTLAAFFAVTSLFAVGGGNSVIPEMHRYAVMSNTGCPTGSSPIPSRWRSSRRGQT
jgi:hypothetical protein